MSNNTFSIPPATNNTDVFWPDGRFTARWFLKLGQGLQVYTHVRIAVLSVRY